MCRGLADVRMSGGEGCGRQEGHGVGDAAHAVGGARSECRDRRSGSCSAEPPSYSVSVVAAVSTTVSCVLTARMIHEAARIHAVEERPKRASARNET